MAWQPIFRRRTVTGETVTGVEARAGFLDRPVLVVLAVSLALIAVIFGTMLLGIW
jgi:hypothetical protein